MHQQKHKSMANNKDGLPFSENQSFRRDVRGRFCTQERQAYDKALNENKILRHERDKWYRAYLCLSNDNSRLTRQLNELKQKIKLLYEGQKHCVT